MVTTLEHWEKIAEHLPASSNGQKLAVRIRAACDEHRPRGLRAFTINCTREEIEMIRDANPRIRWGQPRFEVVK